MGPDGRSAADLGRLWPCLVLSGLPIVGQVAAAVAALSFLRLARRGIGRARTWWFAGAGVAATGAVAAALLLVDQLGSHGIRWGIGAASAVLQVGTTLAIAAHFLALHAWCRDVEASVLRQRLRGGGALGVAAAACAALAAAPVDTAAPEWLEVVAVPAFGLGWWGFVVLASVHATIRAGLAELEAERRPDPAYAPV